VRYFKGKNIDCCRSQNEFILLSDSSLISVEKCQKFSAWWFIVFLIFLLFSVLLLALLSLFLICFSLINLRCLCLNTEISNFLFIPIEWNRNMVLSKIIANKSINLCVINMEIMINCRSCATCIIGNNTYFFSICIDGTVPNVSN
jgi:hypothetical protein